MHIESSLSGVEVERLSCASSALTDLRANRRDAVCESLQARHQRGQVLSNDAPERVAIDPEVAVDQAITRGDDHPRRDLLVRAPELVRNVCGCFAEQFQIAYGCIVGQAAVEKLGLGELSRIAQRSFPEAKHVQDVKPPFARSLTHEGLRVR